MVVSTNPIAWPSFNAKQSHYFSTIFNAADTFISELRLTLGQDCDYICLNNSLAYILLKAYFIWAKDEQFGIANVRLLDLLIAE